MTKLHDADPVPKGDFVLIADASSEGGAISSALQQRGFAVDVAPLTLLESRLLSDAPHVILIDVDEPGSLEAIERLGELSVIHRAVLVFMGDPEREGALRAVGASGKLFPRPVDVEQLVDHVAMFATPIHKVSRVRESSLPEASAPRDTMPPPTNDSDSPGPVDNASNQDPFDIESILPFGEDVLKPPADLPAHLSPELEQLMLSAERRVGTLVRRSSIPPADEEDAALPPEYLSILDEPLESEEDDSFVGFPSFEGTPVPPESEDPVSSDRRAETDKQAGGAAQGAADEAPPTPRERRAPYPPPPEVLSQREPMADRPLPAPGRVPEETPKAGTYFGQQLEAMSRASVSSAKPAETTSGPSGERATASRGAAAPPTVTAQITAGRSGPMSHAPATEAMTGSPFSLLDDPSHASGAPYDDSPRRSVVTRAGVTRAGVTRGGPDPSSGQAAGPVSGMTFPEISARFAAAAAPPPEATHRAPSVAPPPPPVAAPPRPPAPPAPPAPPPPPVVAPPQRAPRAPTPPPPPVKNARADVEQIPAALGELDAPVALAHAIAGRVSGSLALASEAGVRRIVLQDGDVVTAASWVADETLLAFLAGRGDIEREHVPQLEGKLPSYGRIAGAALIARGHLGQDDLWPVLRAHAEWIIGRALLIPSGTCELETEAPARLTQEPNVFGGAAGAEVLIESVRRVIPPEVATARMGGARARVMAGPRHGLLSECALRSDEVERIRSPQGRSVGDIAQGADAEMPAVLYALACLGVVEVIRAVTPAREEAPAEPDPYDEEAVRQRVRARLALVEDGDYFALLGVPRSATSYEVRRAYMELRRAFEPTRLLTAATADLHGDVRVVLEVLEEAFDILREPRRRERYRRAIESAGPS